MDEALVSFLAQNSKCDAALSNKQKKGHRYSRPAIIGFHIQNPRSFIINIDSCTQNVQH